MSNIWGIKKVQICRPTGINTDRIEQEATTNVQKQKGCVSNSVLPYLCMKRPFNGYRIPLIDWIVTIMSKLITMVWMIGQRHIESDEFWFNYRNYWLDFSTGIFIVNLKSFLQFMAKSVEPLDNTYNSSSRLWTQGMLQKIIFLLKYSSCID